MPSWPVRRTVRALGVALALAGVGVVGGYAGGALTDDPGPRASVAAPLPAVSPSYPVDPPLVVQPDPAVPPMSPDLALRAVTVGSEAFPITLPVPADWEQSQHEGEWRFMPPDFVVNTYFLRVRSIANANDTIERARSERLRDLESAAGVQELAVETEEDDGFVVSYVGDGYRRVAMERFFSLDGDDTARVSVALVGRERDRTGMRTLLRAITERISR